MCKSYFASNTSSATFNTLNCTFSSSVGTTIMISDCASAGCLSNPQTDQVIRLLDSTGLQVATGDDDPVCGKCAKIVYNVPMIAGVSTQRFTLQQGCYGHSSCSGTFTVSKVATTSCTSYSKSFTSSATTNTSSCTFTACPGSSISISDKTCIGLANDQFIRLYDTSNTLITSNDDATSSTRCAAIETSIASGSCQLFTLRQGCSGDSSCTGSFQVYGVATGVSSFTFTPSAIGSVMPTLNPSTLYPSFVPTTMVPTMLPSLEPSLLPSSFSPTGITASKSKTSVGIYVCNPYSAANTSDATINTAICVFTAPAGVSLLISDCSSPACTADIQDDQFIRLFDSDGNEVAFNDNDDDEICGLCSKIVYSTPANSTLMTYTLVQGCKGLASCSGAFSISMLTTLTCSPYWSSYSLTASRNTCKNTYCYCYNLYYIC